MCYNNFTYESPPLVALGEFESPRQLASGCQDRHVCQFHHSAIKSSGEGSFDKGLPSPKPLLNLIILLKLVLSIDKSTQIGLILHNKCNQQGVA